MALLDDGLGFRVVGIACIIYPLVLFVYRITLHPLARFPGPKLAAITYWYEFYQDVIKPGRYVFKIEELHRQYGPVLRVNPNEIHIRDPEFYTEIYSSKPYQVDRDRWYDLKFLEGALPFTRLHEPHARRRQSLTNYFSMRALRTLESRITNVASIMTDRLHQMKGDGTIIILADLFSAFGLDVVTEYSLGKEGSMNLMSHPEFGKMWTDMGKVQMPTMPFARHFKSIMNVFLNLPDWLALRIAPFVAGFIHWQRGLQGQIDDAIRRRSTKGGIDMSLKSSILDELVASPDLTEEDKAPRRLRDEMTLLLGAGSETTTTVLSRTVYYLLANPSVQDRLRQELQEALPNPKAIPSLDTVAILPYLNAVIEEGLRISLPVMQRSPRVFRHRTIQYGQWIIPPKTAVSQSTYFVSMNPDIFPSPFEFRPERWLEDTTLQRYQVTFSKGRRMCLGISLAYAELRLALAVLFRRFDLELYETTLKDVTVVHDYQVGWADRSSKGIRVKVVGERA